MAKRKRGIVYTDALARRICDLIAEGASLATIGEMPNMPARSTVRGWLEDHPDFDRRYEIARRQRTDNLVDEAIAIADSVRGTDSNAAVGAAKLACDTRRWLASKLLPERFGDQLSLTGSAGTPLIPAAEPDASKTALAILSLLRQARRDADPQPIVEHEAAEPAPVHLEIEPVPDARYALPSRTLLNTIVPQEPAPDFAAHQEAAIEQQNTKLRLVSNEESRLRAVQYGPRDYQPRRNSTRGRGDDY